MNKKIIFLTVCFSFLLLFGCVQESPEIPECTSSLNCSNNEQCSNEECIKLEGECGYTENHEWISYECCKDSECSADKECTNNECVLKQGCTYNNPECNKNKECIDNICILKQGCEYNNPECLGTQTCINNACTCNSNSDCEETEACITNLCKEVECREDLDCGNPSKECLNYNCKSRDSCLINADCNYDEVCVAQQCNKILNCTSGSCEDNYFKLKEVTFEEYGTSYLFRAVITAKTEIKGSFRILWNEVQGSGYLTSVEMEFEEDSDELRLWISMDPLTYEVEHFIIEHAGEPNLLYLVKEFEEIE